MATATQIMQSSALTTHPQSPGTTATVREHACLFTHDLRRKQKRWQDGRLKYHTFNRRVMVYDERGNFVGDTHWREDYDLADGDDLELERGGILIQVGECVGTRDQDLSELIDKRTQERAQRQAAAAARRPPVATVATLHHVKQQSIPQKHLHDIIGTPSGHHGRAVLPKESPYEECQQRQSPPQSDDTRPAKRQRRGISPLSRAGYAQNLFGATLTLSGRPSSQASAHNRSSRQIAFQLKDAQPSTRTFARLRNPARPEPALHTNQGTLDELGTSPTLQKRRPRLTADQHEESIGGSVIDSQSTNEKSCVSKETDESLKRPDLSIGQSGRSQVLGGSKKVRDKKRSSAGDGCAHEHKKKNPNLIDLTKDQADNSKQSVYDEPRTELRIKPRKKRGLLMISERESLRDSSSISEPTNRRPSDHHYPPSPKAQTRTVSSDKSGEKGTSTNAQHNSINPSKRVRENTSQRKKTSREDDNQESGNSGHESSCVANTRRFEGETLEEMPCLDQLNSDSWAGASLRSAGRRGSYCTAEMSAVEIKRSLRSARRASIEDTTSSSGADQNHGHLPSTRRKDNVVVDEMPAPRLAKLSRKSIKSKEVIGFIFEDDDEPDVTVSLKQDGHAQKEPSLNRPPDQDIDEHQHQSLDGKICDGLVTTERPPDAELGCSRKPLIVTQGQKNWKSELPGESRVIIETEQASTTTKTLKKQPKPPISNPATRGKKAAKPSDAAGQMPICPLPTESVESSFLRRNHSERIVCKNSDKLAASPMPCFSRANGGPWSREANDLFDFKRPS
ncbi:hypothetical protein GGR55DRAFT_277779 [Xylaria sp. FL0064]|nr:hypothetical protein GGR55DRAFT_277779 [Xylaria sp. FL0064]